MSIEIGSIVLVTAEETLYFQKCGKVVEVSADGDEDGPVGVRFHKEDIYHFVRHESECIVRFEEDELQVIPDWPIENKARKLFYGRYHTLFQRKYAFSLENDCQHRDCKRRASVRILTNEWGSVCEYDVCKEHSQLHGMCMDVFPQKINYEPKVQNPREASV